LITHPAQASGVGWSAALWKWPLAATGTRVRATNSKALNCRRRVRGKCLTEESVQHRAAGTPSAKDSSTRHCARSHALFIRYRRPCALSTTRAASSHLRRTDALNELPHSPRVQVRAPRFRLVQTQVVYRRKAAKRSGDQVDDTTPMVLRRIDPPAPPMTETKVGSKARSRSAVSKSRVGARRARRESALRPSLSRISSEREPIRGPTAVSQLTPGWAFTAGPSAATIRAHEERDRKGGYGRLDRFGDRLRRERVAAIASLCAVPAARSL
jgi:hypothetical protein